MSTDYHVLVVGGGYAGAAAALGLARLGFGDRVLVVDRRHRAGYPAQSTSGIASYWLSRFGLDPSPSSVASEIRSFRFFVPGDPPDRVRTLEGPIPVGPGLGVVLREDNFVGRMEAEAERGGVHFWHGASVKECARRDVGYRVLVTDGHEKSVTAEWVLDAGGYDARVSRRFGIVGELGPEDFHMGYEVTTADTGALPAGQVGMWLGSWAPAGYIWSFPASLGGRPARRVGIGTPRSVRDAAGRTVPAKTFFDRWIGECPGYAGEVLAREGGIIPTHRPPRRLHRGRVLALGDAARLCDPTTGGGIAPALASGLAASEAVAMKSPRYYERAINPFRREVRARWWFKQVFLGLGDADLRTLFDLLCTFPIPPGEVSPYDLRRPLLRHLRRGGFRPLAALVKSGRLPRALFG